MPKAATAMTSPKSTEPFSATELRELADASGVEVQTLSPEDAWKLFDAAALKYLHMSGAEFSQRWHDGKFIESDRPEVNRVAMLMPSVIPDGGA